MRINPSEVTKILKEQIKNFGDKAEVTEVGKVLTVGDSKYNSSGGLDKTAAMTIVANTLLNLNESYYKY